MEEKYPFLSYTIGYVTEFCCSLKYWNVLLNFDS